MIYFKLYIIDLLNFELMLILSFSSGIQYLSLFSVLIKF